MNICEVAANASTMYEMNNSKLKKDYIFKNIDLINLIMFRTSGFCGSFGTGYPFYALNETISDNLPIIQEQIRYNNELKDNANGLLEWVCEDCLKSNGANMPDLKQICKPCPEINNSLKPRKVINRLPDIDMWMICEDDKIESAKVELNKKFEDLHLHTSDVDPVLTIYEMKKIAEEISNGIMPCEWLPIDIHIIEYSKFAYLLDNVPLVLLDSFERKKIPYLPIHPISLRKVWQYDDTAYNFVMDYLFSLTPFNFTSKLEAKLMYSRKIISSIFGPDQLMDMLVLTMMDSARRRFETVELKECYKERIKSWKK